MVDTAEQLPVTVETAQLAAVAASVRPAVVSEASAVMVVAVSKRTTSPAPTMSSAIRSTIGRTVVAVVVAQTTTVPVETHRVLISRIQQAAGVVRVHQVASQVPVLHMAAVVEVDPSIMAEADLTEVAMADTMEVPAPISAAVVAVVDMRAEQMVARAS